MPSCDGCQKNKPKSCFSGTQIKKRSKRKCKQCVIIANKAQQIKKEAIPQFWSECNKIPLDIFQIIKLNNHKFLIISHGNNMYIYDTINDKWIKVPDIQYTNNIKSIAYNHNNQQLFIFIIINNKTRIMRFKYHDRINIFSALQPLYLSQHFLYSEDLSSIFINGEYHIIQNNELLHQCLNSKTKEFEKIAQFDDYLCLQEALLINNKPQNKLYLFQGIEWFKAYSFDNKKWSKWKQIKVEQASEMEYYGHSLNRNGTQLTLFTQRYCWRYKNWIEMIVIDMNTFEVTQTSIKHGIPKFKVSSVIISTNDIIDHKFIYDYYTLYWIDNKGTDNNNNNIPILPLEIVNVIYNMIEKERLIHLFSNDKRCYRLNMKYLDQYKIKS